MQRNPLNANTLIASVKTTSSQFETYDGGVLTKCKVEFDPIQDLHGYDNPWVGGAGKNLIETPFYDGATKTQNNVTFTVNADYSISVSITGTASADTYYNIIQNNAAIPDYIQIGQSYIINGGASSNVTVEYADKKSGWGNYAKSNGADVSFTPRSDITYVAIYVLVKSGTSGNYTVYPMLRLSTESDPTFEPYSNICPISGHTEVQVKNNSTTYTINLGGTYYEGTLDVATGELTATRAYIKASSVESVAVDGGTYYWRVKTGLSSTNGANAISSHFKSVYSAALGNCYITASGAQLLAIPYDQTLNTLAAANTWCAANQPEFCYKLATPTTIKILPTYIKSNVGMNTVSCPLSNQYISTNGIEYKDVFAYRDIRYSEAANVSRYIGWNGESSLTVDLAEYSDGIYFVFATPEHSTNGAFAVLYRQYTSLVILYQTSNNVFSVLGTELTYSGDWYSHIYLKEAIGYVFY